MTSVIMVGLLAAALFHFLGPVGVLLAFGVVFIASKK